MEQYFNHFTAGWQGFVAQVLHPGWGNFFWLLVIASVGVFLLELARPWRRQQYIMRPELGQDIFYMFFNMFLFPLGGFATISLFFTSAIESTSIAAALRGWIPLQNLPHSLQLVALFVSRDFLQWGIHVMLHRAHFCGNCMKCTIAPRP